MEENLEIIDLKEIFNVIKNKWKIIVAVTLIFGIGGLLISKIFIPEKFEANSTMIVNTREDQNAVVTYDQINSARQLVSTYAVILKSDTILDKVIENLRLHDTKEFADVTSKDLAKKVVTVSQIDTTQVINIRAVTKSADLSEKIVSEIVKLAPNLIIQTVKAGSVEVISAPKANQEKISPSNFKNTVIAIVLGLILSVGGVLLLHFLDNTFSTEEDIKKYLDLKVLGVIPTIKEQGGN